MLVKRTELLRTPFSATMQLGLVSFLFALAVGAKLYPIMLAPILFWVIAKNIGLRYTVLPVAAFALMSVIVVWPILPHDRGTGLDPSVGVKTFLRRWEMNDFIFMVLIENMKPTAQMPQDQIAWFSILPESAGHQVTDFLANWWEVERYPTRSYNKSALAASQWR